MTGAASMVGFVLEHSAWATGELHSFCEPLPAEQLAATAPGAFGTVFETLHHFIESDGHYVRRVAPQLWPADLHPDANDAWEASLGGPAAFQQVRATAAEGRVRARRAAFLSGDLPEAFALLRSRAETVAELWRTWVNGDPDPSSTCAIPGTSDESTAAVQVAQAVGHSHEHREQIRAILTSLGHEPPDISGMAWGRAHGLLRAVS
jgi:uncharacterized damage-inducible protein DinB